MDGTKGRIVKFIGDYVIFETKNQYDKVYHIAKRDNPSKPMAYISFRPEGKNVFVSFGETEKSWRKMDLQKTLLHHVGEYAKEIGAENIYAHMAVGNEEAMKKAGWNIEKEGRISINVENVAHSVPKSPSLRDAKYAQKAIDFAEKIAIMKTARKDGASIRNAARVTGVTDAEPFLRKAMLKRKNAIKIKPKRREF